VTGPRRAAVLGHPIAHSLSPVLHRAAYRELGLDWTYDAVDVTAEMLPAFVVGRGPEWVGLSLTMPLKHAVLPLLDTAEDLVSLVGAANTLVWRDGRRLGANTDVTGMQAALAERGLRDVAEATVLGSGATAASAVAALGLWSVPRITVVARRPEAAAPLHAVAERLGTAVRALGWDEATRALRAPLVVSTVPAGVADALAGQVPEGPGALLDVVYAPWPTRLGEAWREAAGVVVSGLDLLVHQAVGQVRLMTGRDVDVAVLRAALGR